MKKKNSKFTVGEKIRLLKIYNLVRGDKMKKTMLAKAIILLILSIQCFGKGSNNSNNGDKDCYVPKGEIHCVTDLNTPEGQQKLKEFSKMKSIY